MQSNMIKRINQVQRMVQQLPSVAATTCEQLLDQGQAKQTAPDGTRWAPVAGRGFDPAGHITYEVAVTGAGQVVLRSSHRAAGYTRWGTRRMPARPKVPGVNGSAAWMPKILQALRRVMAVRSF